MYTYRYLYTYIPISNAKVTANVTRCWNKSSPKFPPKSIHSSFYLKSGIFKLAQKVNQKFGLLLYDYLLTKTLKNRPIWSHCKNVVQYNYFFIFKTWPKFQILVNVIFWSKFGCYCSRRKTFFLSALHNHLWSQKLLMSKNNLITVSFWSPPGGVGSLTVAICQIKAIAFLCLYRRSCKCDLWWYHSLIRRAGIMELFSRKIWRLKSAQLSIKFDYCPRCNNNKYNIVLYFHKHNNLPLGQIHALISC